MQIIILNVFDTIFLKNDYLLLQSGIFSRRKKMSGLILMSYTKAMRRIESTGKKFPRDVSMLTNIIIAEYEQIRAEIIIFKIKRATAYEHYITAKTAMDSFKPNTLEDQIKHGSLFMRYNTADKNYKALIAMQDKIDALKAQCRALYADIANLAPAKAVTLERI